MTRGAATFDPMQQQVKSTGEPRDGSMGERAQRNQREILLAVALTLAAVVVLLGYAAV